MSTKILEVELTEPLPAGVEGAERYDRVWIAAFRSGIPIGRVLIENGRTPIPRTQLASAMAVQLGRALAAELDPEQLRDGLPEPRPLLPDLQLTDRRPLSMSIVVCTRDRPKQLRRCLAMLTGMETGDQNIELLVVDNNPDSGLTAPVVAEFGQIRYTTERRPGEPYARNAGIAAASGEIIAYIDDDVVVPPSWAARILEPFADPRVACVSGLVLPLTLETRSQELYEEYGGLGRGYTPRLLGMDFFRASNRHPVPTWELGGTANVAIRKSVLQEIGGFDESLGAGVPGGVGTDIYMFYQVLKRGYYCYYHPAAYVWHEHRQELPALKRQLSDYARGQVSYQLRTLLSDGDRRALWQVFRWLPEWYARRTLATVIGRSHFPLPVIAAELGGHFSAPFALYRSSRRRAQLADAADAGR